MPDDFAVGRVEKRCPKASEIERAAGNTFAVPFRLSQDALGAEGELLCLDNTENPPIDAQSVISGAIRSFELFYRTGFPAIQRHARRKPNELPSRSFELRVDEALSRKPFGILL